MFSFFTFKFVVSCAYMIVFMQHNNFGSNCLYSLGTTVAFLVLEIICKAPFHAIMLNCFSWCCFQLENYAKTEEAKVEGLIKAVAESGAKVIVSGAAVGEMALHFCERYKYLKFPFFALICLHLCIRV